MYTGFWWGSLKEGDHLEDLSIDGRVIGKCVLKKQDGVVWIGLICLRIWSVGGLLKFYVIQYAKYINRVYIYIYKVKTFSAWFSYNWWCGSMSCCVGQASLGVNVFNNVILARNRQLPDDDPMIETCRSIFKSFNAKNLRVCIYIYIYTHTSVYKALTAGRKCFQRTTLNTDLR